MQWWVYLVFCVTTARLLCAPPCWVWPASSWTSQSKCFSPTNRKGQSNQPSLLPRSSPVASTSTSPSTRTTASLVEAVFFSTSIVCCAKGPSWTVQLVSNFPGRCLTALGCPLRKCSNMLWPTSEVTRVRSCETCKLTLARLICCASGPGLRPSDSLGGEGVVRPRKKERASPPLRPWTVSLAAKGLSLGTSTVRARGTGPQTSSAASSNGMCDSASLICSSLNEGKKISRIWPEEVDINAKAETQPSGRSSESVAGSQRPIAGWSGKIWKRPGTLRPGYPSCRGNSQ
mmetsp:Transcript_143709/g.374275  ORF Transcript_143709/g.374275 Transcript_143709/m.374275 type:complete len:288 (-) Transcript_143709:390-1253(-)